jgi:hypothetical protein
MTPIGPSLNALTPITATDDRDPVSAWPAPLAKVEDADPGRLEFATRALPIDPGRWGRPPAEAAEQGSRSTWVPVGAPPPPPTVSTPAAPVGPTARGRRRRYRVWVEAALGMVILAGLALVAPSRPAGLVRDESAAVTRWTSTALPVLTNLSNDAATIERDSGPASIFPAPGDDAARYDSDVATAQRLPSPPDAGLAQAWRAALTQLTAARSDPGTLLGGSPEALARTHVHFAALETVLLEFEQQIRPAQ